MAKKKGNIESDSDNHELLPLDFSSVEEEESWLPLMRGEEKPPAGKEKAGAETPAATTKNTVTTTPSTKMNEEEKTNTRQTEADGGAPAGDSPTEQPKESSLREEMLADAPRRISVQAQTLMSPPPAPAAPPAPPPKPRQTEADGFKIEPMVIPLNMQFKGGGPQKAAQPPEPPKAAPEKPKPDPARAEEKKPEPPKKAFWEPQKPEEARPKPPSRASRLFDPDTIFSDDEDDEPFPSADLLMKKQEPRLTPYGRRHIGADMFDKEKEREKDDGKDVKKAEDVFVDESEGSLQIPIAIPEKRRGEAATASKPTAPEPPPAAKKQPKDKKFLSKLPLFKPLKAKEPVQIISCISGENATPGQILQEARIKCGYSITQVEQETKIRLDYLEALENDEYKKLPPIVYINAYIKNLGSLYNLSPEMANHILNAIKKDGKKMTAEEIIKDVDTDKPGRIEEARMRQVVKLSAFAAIAAVAVVAGVLAAMFMMAGQRGGAPFEEEEIEPAQQQKKVVKDEPLPEPIVKQQTDGAAKAQALVFSEADLRKFMPPQTITMTELPFETDKN